MKEEEIRPREIFDELLRLSRADIETFFRGVGVETVECPACGGKGEAAFVKDGFEYQECPGCATLFANPRPPAPAFERYYRESESSRYWATTFYKATEDARREKIWRPKARQVRTILEKWLGDTSAEVFDIGGGYGVFAEELGQLGTSTTVIEPAPHLAQVCRDKKLKVVEAFLEDVVAADLPVGRKVFTSFELLEHLHSPLAFFRHLRTLAKDGDLVVFTTLSGMGLDIRVLWERSKSVSPPHHLNFLNPRSIPILLDRAGFECIEVSTPGVLDVDILYNQTADVHDRFWKAFLEHSSVEARTLLQRAVTESGWSSHMLTVARAL